MNSNDYRRGYNDGRNDAKNGKDKDYSRAGLTTKFIFGGNATLDSYIEGYNEGYRVGMKEN